jgi:hypothetical protein
MVLTLSSIALDFDIPVVERLPSTSNIDQILEYVRAQEGTEGIVIRFYNGHMLKIKSEWYLAIHGAKDAITEEKNVVQMIIDETLDDAKALVLDEDRKNLDRYEGDFWKLVDDYISKLFGHIVFAWSNYDDRKDYALRGDQKNSYVRAATFRFFDNDAASTQDIRDYVIEKIIRPALSTRTKFGVMKSEVLHGLRQYV